MAQVRKLHSFKLSAIRVSEGCSRDYADVKEGRDRYGGNVLMSMQVFMFV